MTQQGKITLYNDSWILEKYPMLMVDQTDIELQILEIDHQHWIFFKNPTVIVK